MANRKKKEVKKEDVAIENGNVEITETCEVCLEADCECPQGEEFKVVITEEAMEDNPELKELGVEAGDEAIVEECPEDCECHEPKDFAEVSVEDDESAVSIMHANGGVELKEDGIYVNGKLSDNPTRVFNALHEFIGVHFSLKSKS